MWQALWPDRPVDEVPIGHVTNGVHVPTWIGAPMRELLDRHLGDGLAGRAPPTRDLWAAVDRIPDAELWEARERAARRARRRSSASAASSDRLARGDSLDYVEAAAHGFDPDVLTIGFARRVATYKRLDLLTRDPEWTHGAARRRAPGAVRARRQGPPARRGGQAHRCRRCSGSSAARIVGERVVFLDDYDLAIGGPARARAATSGSTCRARRSRRAAPAA